MFESRREQKQGPQPRFKAAFYVYLTCWGLLCLYGIVWRTPKLVLAAESWLLLVAFVLFSAPWVLLTVNGAREKARREWEKDKARIASQGSLFGEPAEPSWELTGRTVAGLAGLLLVTTSPSFMALQGCFITPTASRVK